MRHIFIINPAAGKTDSSEEIRQQIHNLKTDDPVEIYITKDVGDAKVKAQSEASVGDEIRIYACGGDGTANEVLAGIQGHKNCSLGIIPVGSGNDFVKAFDSLAKEDFLDLQRMVDGEEMTIDLIECCGKYSMNVVSIGFDASVAKNMVKFKRWPLVSGSLAYKLAIAYSLFTQRKHKVKVWVDDKPFGNADYKKTTLLALGANGKYYGGGFKAAPFAKLDDGYMEFLHCKTLSILKLASIIGTYTKGEHYKNPKMPFMSFDRCKKLRFEAEKPICLNIDGEIYFEENPELVIQEAALRIILPKKN